MKFRYLNKNEVQVKIQSIKEKQGASLVIYKDSRVDMAMLDEVVGPMNWKREHNGPVCTVSVWCDEKKQWVSKSDVGECSDYKGNVNEKGLASDSFKRACVNWGIGRELYTAPFIWINGEYSKYDKFSVVHYLVEDGVVTQLQVVNDKTGELVYQLGTRDRVPNSKPKGDKNDSKGDKNETQNQDKKPFNRDVAIKLIIDNSTQTIIDKQLSYHKLDSVYDADEKQLRMMWAYLKKLSDKK